MSDRIRWSCRSVGRETIGKLSEVHEISGIPYGELMDECVARWYSALPEQDLPEEEEESAVMASACFAVQPIDRSRPQDANRLAQEYAPEHALNTNARCSSHAPR